MSYIYLINLNRRPDRKNVSLQRLKTLNINNVNIFSAAS